MRRLFFLLCVPALGAACSSNGSHGGQEPTGSGAGSNATSAASGSSSSSGASSGAGGASVGASSSASSASSAAAAGGASGASASSSGVSTASSGSSSGSSSSGAGFMPDGGVVSPCSLPGSVVYTSTGKVTVPGGLQTWPDLGAFLTLPVGFCAHYFGTVGDARQLRFAPGGELFVASPSALTTGGNPTNALDAIVLLPDDNLDGVADAVVTFLSFPKGSMTQGMLFAPGFFYYQDGTPPGTQIKRIPYAAGDRQPSAAGAVVADLSGPNVHTSMLHWTKTMDMADDGTIYVANGSDQGESCVSPHVFVGGIYAIDPAPGGPNPNGRQIAQGFRNPAAVRCNKGYNACFAAELALDYSFGQGGREKLVPIRQGDDWGFPCCASQNTPYLGYPSANCSGVAAETNSFYIGDTPFGFDFEPGAWPAPYTHNAFVVTHGAAGSWTGARMVAIPVDSNGAPSPSTDLMGQDTGMIDFATGWDDTTLTHGRPSAVAFSPDGRLFVANDNNGVIFWIAPAQ